MKSCTIEFFNLLRWYSLEYIQWFCYHKNAKNIVRCWSDRELGSIGVILAGKSYLNIRIILKLWIPEHDKVTVFFWTEIHLSKSSVEKFSYFRSSHHESMRHIVWSSGKIFPFPEESISLLPRSLILYDTLGRSLNRPTFLERRIFWKGRHKFTIIV